MILKDENPRTGRQSVKRLRERAVDFVRSDTALRIPRAEADREHGFARWLGRYRERLQLALQEDLVREHVYVPASLGAEIAHEFFSEQVWPAVEPLLQGYAVRGLAASWARKSMGDAVTYGWPIPSEGLWRVPVGVAGYGDRLGEIMLDEDGNVLEERSITGSALREILRGHSSSRAETASQ